VILYISSVNYSLIIDIRDEQHIVKLWRNPTDEQCVIKLWWNPTDGLDTTSRVTDGLDTTSRVTDKLKNFLQNFWILLLTTQNSSKSEKQSKIQYIRRYNWVDKNILCCSD
jgi:hypothetical protein